MSGVKNIALAMAITVMLGLPILTFVKNPVAQGVGIWASLLIGIRVAFDFTANPLKVAIITGSAVFILQMMKRFSRESFVAEAICESQCNSDAFAEPEKRLDERIDRLLFDSQRITDDLNDFLHINTPDERAS